MKTKFVFKFYSILIVIVLLLGTGIPGGLKVGTAQGNPQLSVHLKENAIFGFDWQYPGDTPIISIVDPNPGGINLSPVQMNWELGGYWSLNLNGIYSLQPGQVVTMTQGEVTKQITIIPFSVDHIDITADTVSGTTTPFTMVYVYTGPDWTISRSVRSDAQGYWSANFHAEPYPIETQSFDITLGTTGQAYIVDEDGDTVQETWRVLSPKVTAHLNENRIDIVEWPANQPVNLTIFGTGEPPYELSLTADANGYANFVLGWDFTLEPGRWVTVSGAGYTKSLTVMDLYVDVFDPVEKVVKGHSAPYAWIAVNLWINDGFQNVQANESGEWQATYDNTPGPFYPNTRGDVFNADEDGDSTSYFFNTGNIFSWAPGYVSLQNCLNYRSYTLEIDDPGNGLGVDYTDAAQAQLGEDGNQVVALFPLTNFWLDAGDKITISSDHDVRTLIVAPMGSLSFDTQNDIISGVNQPNEWMGIGTPMAWREVQTDENGEWSIDYKVVGSRGEPIEDIVPWMTVCSFEYDADADFSSYCMGVPNPRFDVRANVDQVESWEWPLGATLTLFVNGGFVATQEVGTAPWDPNSTYVSFDLAGTYDLQPGDEVSLSDGVVTKSTVVTDLEFTDIDWVNDTVSGIATPSNRLDVWACDSLGCHNRHVDVDEGGNWIADFAHPGDEPDEQDIVDITSGTWIDSREWDEDGDATMFGQNAPNPGFVVEPTGHWAYAWDWPANEELTMTIGEGGTQIFATTESTGPWTSAASFDLTGIELTPGMVVYVEGAGINKSLVLADFSVELDLFNNTLSGTASSPGNIISCADNAPGNCRSATAVDGQWSMLPDPEGFVLAPGVFGWAAEEDEDGDMTRMDWWAPNFRFDARANEDVVEAWEWPVGDVLTLVINGETFTKTVEAPDSDLTYVAFNLSGIVDIQPGQTISLSDEIFTKTTVVTPLEFTHSNLIEDTVSGEAAPNSYFDIWACGPDGCPVRHVLVDESGNWSVDFAQPGAGSDEQGTVDLTPGTWIDSRETDSDSDGTMYGIFAPFPTSGSATGEGWFDSPSGAYTEDPALAGKATLEFATKYSKKTEILSGNVQFSFKRFSFTSTALDWLVIENGRMQLTGLGKINGKAGYSFTLNAVDNPPGLNAQDTIHIRIWETSTGNMIYDNMPGEPDYVMPVTPLNGGGITLTP